MSTLLSPANIAKIRESSRLLVREFGFMRKGVAATSLPPSALHTLIEIDLKGPQTAADLCQKLNLEKSSVSRMLKKLIDSGEIKESINPTDARKKQLCLSTKGKQTAEIAHNFAIKQVKSALQGLPAQSIATVMEGLATYSKGLEAQRTGHLANNDTQAQITTGYQAGAIGHISALFARYFSRHYDFGQYFEKKVATELAEFTDRLDHPKNQLWLVTNNQQIMGSLAIDGEHFEQDNIAHLRWFILDNSLTGQGLGKRLLESAIVFCQAQAFREIHLWTVKGLDASSHLYERYDFPIEEEFVDKQWGTQVIEQKRVKHLR